MEIRPLISSDFDAISPVLDEWWGGRAVRHLLPRLFFEHFADTCFAMADGDQIRAFLVGFRSQSRPHVGYIHFAGVAPECRGKGYGRRLYTRFIDVVTTMGCTEVRCITSPQNAASIAFHRRMGFEVLPGDGHQDGVAVQLNHAGTGQHRVVFRKVLPTANSGSNL